MTTVCVVGGGPAGAMLSLLLARAGIEVVQLEKHADFLRDFRGDTVHPSTLQVLDEIGLAEEFLALPHRKVPTVRIVENGREHDAIDVRLLNIPRKYIAFVPQWEFLNLLTRQAQCYPIHRLIMRANAYGLIHDATGRVSGVRYRDPTGEHELGAQLVIAADGRHSAIRTAAGLTPRDLGASMDVVMCQLPKHQDDPDFGFHIYNGFGRFVGMLNRDSYWHAMYIIHKGGYARLRREGTAALRQQLSRLVPFLADRVDQLADLSTLHVLEVQSNRLKKWHRPGLLCIGDAAHAMSPIGGVGVNLAIQDAVATANLLTPALRRAQQHHRPVPRRALAAVQRRRQPATIATQALQRFVQRRGIDRALRTKDGAQSPRFGMPDNRFVKRAFTRAMSVGIRPEHVARP